MPEASLQKDYWHTVKDVNLLLYIIFLFTENIKKYCFADTVKSI